MSAKNQSHTPDINKHGLLLWLDTYYDSSIQPHSTGEGVTWIDLSGDYEDDENNPSPDTSLVTGVKCDVSYPSGSFKNRGASFTGGHSGGDEPANKPRGVRFNGKANCQYTMPRNSSTRLLSSNPFVYGSTPFIQNKTINGTTDLFANPIRTPNEQAFTVELWFWADMIGHNQGLICGCPKAGNDPTRTRVTYQEDSVFSIRYKSVGFNNNVSNVIKIGVGNGDELEMDSSGKPLGPANAGKHIKWYETASVSQTRNRWTHLVVSNNPELVVCGGPNGQTTFDTGIRVWINGQLDRPSYEKNFRCNDTSDTQIRELQDIVQLQVGLAETEATPLGQNPEEDPQSDGRNWQGEIGCVRIYNWAFDEDQAKRHLNETKHRFPLGFSLSIG